MPLVSKDYDIRSFGNSGDLHAQPKAELIDTLAGYEGHHVVVRGPPAKVKALKELRETIYRESEMFSSTKHGLGVVHYEA